VLPRQHKVANGREVLLDREQIRVSKHNVFNCSAACRISTVESALPPAAA
jgi:hypothetical protein